jgi:excisionase family DNA binding protein
VADPTTVTNRGTGIHMSAIPTLMTVQDTATLLRTTRTAVYAMVARGQIPGVTRLGRRVLFRTQDLLDWLDRSRTPLPKE